MEKEHKYFLSGAGAMILLWILLYSNGCMTVHEFRNIVTTDTIYIDKPYKEIVIKEIEVEVPKTVYIYKRDTIYREILEKDTLISSIEIDRQTATIHTITPLGIPQIKEYNLPPFRQLRIDHEGNFAITPQKRNRKKFWRTVEQIGIFIGGCFVGSQVIGLKD